MHKIQYTSVQKIFVYTRYMEAFLIISFISFSCPLRRAYIVYAICAVTPKMSHTHFLLPLLVKSQEVGQCKHPKIRTYKRKISKTELRNGTFRDPLGSERMPINMFLNTTTSQIEHSEALSSHHGEVTAHDREGKLLLL